MAGEIVEALRLGSLLAAFPVLYGFFAWLEDLMSPQAKQDIAAWLRRTEVPGSLTTLPRQFIALFDRVFGERHLSWKCFLRSCLASLIVMVILGGLWVLWRPDAAVLYAQRLNENLIENLLFFAVFNVLWNMSFDYFSLLVCRFILGLMARREDSVGVSLIYAVLGTIASAVTYLFLTVYVGIIVITVFWDHIFPVPFDDVNWIFYEYMKELWGKGIVFQSRPGSGSIGVYFYSALFTSAWAWLYALSAGTVRLGLRLQPLLGWLKYLLDVENKPIRSIGAVVGIIGTIIWWTLVLIVGPTG